MIDVDHDALRQASEHRARQATIEGHLSLVSTLFIFSSPLLIPYTYRLPAIIATVLKLSTYLLLFMAFPLSMVFGISGVRRGRRGGRASAWISLILLSFIIILIFALYLY